MPACGSLVRRRRRCPAAPRGWVAAALLAAASAFVSAAALAQGTLPAGGQVVAGSATIGAPAGNTLSITQTSNRAIVNWNSFSIGQPNAVNFSQPGSSAAILNRVTGAATSTIAGQLNANGQVYLVNPNGIAITNTGAVNVGGGFVASTLGIANNDFMAGNLAFSGSGASAGVTNAGTVNAGQGGFAALLGGTAANSGVIQVPLGKVALASGERATLDVNGGGFLQVAAPTGARTAQGQALVSNSGQIVAPGGTVTMSAATVATAVRDAVNMSGVVSANSVSGHNGDVVLGGGPGGTVEVAGSIDVSAPVGGAVNGGAVTVSGAQVSLAGSAVVDARGARGGNVLIGVTAPGGVGKAAQTTIMPGAQVLAGGNPAIASSGGHIETSGDTVSVGGATISAGNGGSWLLDPADLTIDPALAATINSALAGGSNVTETTSAGGSGGTGDINVDAALTWSSAATLTLSAYNNINVNAAITIGGGGQLALTTNNAGANPDATLTFAMGQGSAVFAGGPAAGAGLSINGAPYTLLYDMTGVEGMDGSAGNFALAQPLDATSSGPFSAPPVGSFTGNFNGIGNTIANLTVNTSATNAGLFGQLGAGGTIANFGLVGGSVTNSVGISPATAGSLIGLLDGSVSNVFSTASVNGGFFAGGLVGFSDGTIGNAYATGTVAAGNAFVGGLVGISFGAVTNAYATGSVTGGSGSLVGGLAGENNGTLGNTYATGAVSGPFKVGGLAGENDGTITNGYWDTTTSNAGAGVGAGSDTTTGLATGQLSAGLPGGFSPSVWGNVNNQTTPYLLGNPGPVFVGSDAFLSSLVFTPAQLQAINDDLAGDFALAQSVDATGYAGFSPIGGGTAFTGTFNGLGNVISNLVISTNQTNAGLFGQLGSGATVENVGLVGGSLTDPAPSANLPNVGALVGANNGGTVANAFATGTVTAANAGPSSAVGGLVGLNNTGGTITDSYATGAVTGPADGVNIGGLVGINGATINNAYATGAVTGGNNGAWVGGLVGENSGGTITNAYATGAVTGGSGSITYVGGLVGNNSGGSAITNGYATGAVSGGSGSSVGGLVGNNDGSAADGYWNEDRAGTATGIGQNTGTVTSVQGLSGAAPFTASSYGGFAFTTTPGTQNAWVIVDADGSLNNAAGAAGGTMPMLAFEASNTILNAHQLQLMAMNLGANYTLAGNIDASATGSSTGATSGTDVWGSAGFVPVGNGIVGAYSGTFDGAGHTIGDLTIDVGNTPIGQYAGLFGQSAGTIENLGLIGGLVTDGFATNGSAAGSVAGYNDGTVSNSFSSAAVTGGANTGGLVGTNFGGITDSYASGAVTGAGAVGGLVGFNGGGITDAYATGVVGGSGILGGLVGFGSGTVSDGYYDAGTTGQPLGLQGNGSLGMTTAALQAALPAFLNPGAWGIVAGESYPYLAFQFPASQPQVIAGRVYSDQGVAPAGAGVVVSDLVDGVALSSVQTGGTVTTGANGYYYYLLAPGTIPAGGDALSYVAGGLAGATLADQITTGYATNTPIYANTLLAVTPATNYSTVQSDLAIAEGGDPTASAIVANLANLTIAASGSFAIDQPIARPGGTVTVDAGGAISQSAGIAATNLVARTALDAGAPITLTDPANAISGNLTLSVLNSAGTAPATGAGGDIAFADSTGFTIAAVDAASLGVVTSTSGTANLTGGGAIGEAAGSNIAAGNLVVTTMTDGGAPITLDQPGNAVPGNVTLTSENAAGTLADAGGIVFADSAGFTIAGIGGLQAGIATTGAVTLRSGGAIGETGTIDPSSLEVNAIGPVSLTTANNVGDLAFSITGPGGRFAFRNDSTDLTITTVGATVGGSTNDGQIQISTTTGGNITIDSAIGSTGGEIDIAAAPGSGIVNQAAAIASSGGNIVLLGDTLALAGGTGSVNAGAGAIVLGPATANDNIALGSPGGGGTLGLQTADFATLTAGQVQIGYRNQDGSETGSFSGDISIGGSGVELVAAQTPAMLLVTGAAGTVTQTQPIAFDTPNAGSFGVISGGAVTLIDPGNSFATVAGFVDGAGAAFSVTSGEGLTVGALPGSTLGVAVDGGTGLAAAVPLPVKSGLPGNPLAGVTTNNGAVTLTTNAGNLTLAASIATGAAGTTTATADLISIASIDQTGGTITAGVLSGSAIGGATLNGANRVGTFGPFGNSGSGDLSFTNAQTLTTAGSVSNTAGDIALATTGGDLVIDGDLTAAGNAVRVDSAGTIDQTAGTVTAAALSGSAVGGAALTQANAIDTFAGFTNAVSGDVSLVDAQSLKTTGTISNTVGNVLLQTTGAGANLTIGGVLSAPNNTLTLISAGTITTPGGTIDAAALTGGSVGGADFGLLDTVARFGPFTDTGGGDLTLIDGVDLAVVGSVTTAGNVTLSVIAGEPNLTIAAPVVSGLTATLVADGTITETGAGAVTATNLIAVTALDGGGAITLNGANNVPGDVTLGSLNFNQGNSNAVAAGPISFADMTGFTVVAATPTTVIPAGVDPALEPGISTNGTVSATAGGDLTIAPGASVTGSSVVLAAAGSFINDAGAGAVAAGLGNRWLIYSNTPSGDTFGNLDSGNTAIWDATLATLPPASVMQPGNRYVFAFQPTLVVTTASLSKTYGDDDAAAVAGAFTIGGLQSGVPGAFLGDTAASVFAGSPAVTSAGSPATADVAASPYAISAAAGSLSILDGYALSFANLGTLTVSPAALTITADNAMQSYGSPVAFGSGEFVAGGLKNGETVGAVSLASAGDSATAGVGGYPIVASNPAGGTFNPANYTISFVNGTLTVTPAALTITADNAMQSYGSPVAFGSGEFVAGGLKNGETVGAVSLASVGDSATAGVGGYPIVASNPTGGTFNPANYTISFVNGTLTVSPAALTAGLTGEIGKVYDGTTLADHITPANYTLSGVVNGDDVALNDPTMGLYASPNVGTGILVTVSGLTLGGGAAGNYVLASTLASADIGTITAAPAQPVPPALAAPPATVPNLATILAVSQPEQPAATSIETKAASPEQLALAAIEIFRPSPCSAAQGAAPALFVVLPSATGHPIGGVTVHNGMTEATLDQSFAAASLQGSALEPCHVSPTAIDATFSQALAARPMLPHQFLLYFAPDSDRLTAESLVEYRKALDDIARRKTYQVEVVGFTDTVGTPAADQQLSLKKAAAVRRLLEADRIDPRNIAIAGRGKLDPLIPTGDQVAEPRNRRVEIWVR